jgi:hypothetical protein
MKIRIEVQGASWSVGKAQELYRMISSDKRFLDGIEDLELVATQGEPDQLYGDAQTTVLCYRPAYARRSREVRVRLQDVPLIGSPTVGDP